MLLCDTNYCHHSLSHIVHYIHMYITTEESGKEWLTIHVSVDSVLHHTIVVERVCTRSPWACSIDTSITVTVFDFSIFLHSKWAVKYNTGTLDTFFRQIKSFLRFRLAFVFGLQTYYLIDFSKNYWLKSLEPKNKG